MLAWCAFSVLLYRLRPSFRLTPVPPIQYSVPNFSPSIFLMQNLGVGEENLKLDRGPMLVKLP